MLLLGLSQFLQEQERFPLETRRRLFQIVNPLLQVGVVNLLLLIDIFHVVEDTVMYM